MATFQVARVDIQDVQLMIVFLNMEFNSKSEKERLDYYLALERCAIRDGFAGSIVAMWQDPSKRTRFIAPPEQHPFFRTMKYEQLLAQVNGNLAC